MALGACALCPQEDARAATLTCHACDARVCASHVRPLYGLCKKCATDEGLERMNRVPEPPHPRENLGIKWIDE